MKASYIATHMARDHKSYYFSRIRKATGLTGPEAKILYDAGTLPPAFPMPAIPLPIYEMMADGLNYFEAQINYRYL